MPDLTPDHPAVEALAYATYRELSGQYGDFRTPSKKEAHSALTAALPHLTADDLRNTPAGRALMAEAWAVGYRDCWGDWEDGRPWSGNLTPNPYREETTDDHA